MYFGVAEIEGSRAHVLSDVGGIPLLDESMPNVEEEELERLLRALLQKVKDAGVYHQDVTLFNIHLCEGSLKIMDFELAEIVSPGGEVADVEQQLEDLMTRFRVQAQIRSRRQKRTGCKEMVPSYRGTQE